MKPHDLFLLSLAAGLTLFTAYVLGGFDAGADPSPEPVPRNPAFRSIVLHHGAGHGRVPLPPDRPSRLPLGDLTFHFLLGNGRGSADGAVERGYRWRDQIPGPHTGRPEIDRESIGICLEGDLEDGPPTRRQIGALLSLLERLCRDYGIPAERVRSHHEVDPGASCPGRGLPAGEIRSALARRLRETAPQGCP